MVSDLVKHMSKRNPHHISNQSRASRDYSFAKFASANAANYANFY